MGRCRYLGAQSPPRACRIRRADAGGYATLLQEKPAPRRELPANVDMRRHPAETLGRRAPDAADDLVDGFEQRHCSCLRNCWSRCSACLSGSGSTTSAGVAITSWDFRLIQFFDRIWIGLASMDGFSFFRLRWVGMASTRSDQMAVDHSYNRLSTDDTKWDNLYPTLSGVCS